MKFAVEANSDDSVADDKEQVVTPFLDDDQSMNDDTYFISVENSPSPVRDYRQSSKDLLKNTTKYNNKPYLSKMQLRTVDKYLLTFAGHFQQRLN